MTGFPDMTSGFDSIHPVLGVARDGPPGLSQQTLTTPPLIDEGTPIGPLDTMIAAHALSIGATLVTNDIGELGRVPGLKAVDWTR